jgi:hypothetical protein
MTIWHLPSGVACAATEDCMPLQFCPSTTGSSSWRETMFGYLPALKLALDFESRLSLPPNPALEINP